MLSLDVSYGNKDVHRHKKLTTNFFKLFEQPSLVVIISISERKITLAMVSRGHIFKGLDNKIMGFDDRFSYKSTKLLTESLSLLNEKKT